MSRGLKASNRNIVNHFFDFLDVIFESIKLLAKKVILEVEKTKSSDKVRSEGGDLEWPCVITKNDTVYSQSGLNNTEEKGNRLKWWCDAQDIL